MIKEASDVELLDPWVPGQVVWKKDEDQIFIAQAKLPAKIIVHENVPERVLYTEKVRLNHKN